MLDERFDLLRKQPKISVKKVDQFPTVFDVWKEILDNRPEVVKQTAKVYAHHPHGLTANQETEVLPVQRIKLSDNERSFYGSNREIKAIGGLIEIRPENYDPTLDYSGAGRWFNDGDFLEINEKYKKSFVIVDFESAPGPDLLKLTIKALEDWRSDWYLLDSGGSFHLIVDELIDPKLIPKYYGQLIIDVAKNLSTEKGKLYSNIGNYLIENVDKPDKLALWVNSVLENFGHIDDPINKGKLVFPIDMRYLAHVVKSFSEGNVDEGCLRVSSKHGSVPILIAQQRDGKVIKFECSKNPFDRKQLGLPNF